MDAGALLRNSIFMLLAIGLMHGCIGNGAQANKNDRIADSNGFGTADTITVSKTKHTTISPEQALALMQSGEQIEILDFTSNYRQRHLKGAKPYESEDPALRDKLAAIDKSKTYLIYCNTQRRSTIAAGIMEELGFRDIRRLEGGINAWIEKGYEIEK